MISRDNIDDTLGIECRLMYTSGYKSFEENTNKFNEEHGFGLDISFRSSSRPSGCRLQVCKFSEDGFQIADP